LQEIFVDGPLILADTCAVSSFMMQLVLSRVGVYSSRTAATLNIQLQSIKSPASRV